MACNGSCRWRRWKAAGRWEAVMRLGNTEAADDDTSGCGVHMRCFGPGRAKPQKAGNRY